MFIKTLLALVAFFSVAVVAWGAHKSPAISAVEPLSASTALVRWDSVEAGASHIQVWLREHTWSGFIYASQAEAGAGWITVSGLEPQRSYQFCLRAVFSPDTAPSGPDFDYVHKRLPIEWVFLPGGEFTMGSMNDDEAPPHRVKLTSFLLSATEITNREYLKYCMTDSLPLPVDPGLPDLREYVRRYPDYPVVNVNWKNAEAYCGYLSRQMNAAVRLPTEAEWEYAATRIPGDYPWGSGKPSRGIANFALGIGDDEAVSLGPVKVKSYAPSHFGLYDLAGNVWEWCSDWYGPYNSRDSIVINPTGPAEGVYKVVRGGSWADSANVLRSANRGRLAPSVAMSTTGFRVARSFPVDPPEIVGTIHAEDTDAQSK
jgi:formylglycine-generating enzyme required for sulfatase activity